MRMALFLAMGFLTAGAVCAQDAAPAEKPAATAAPAAAAAAAPAEMEEYVPTSPEDRVRWYLYGKFPREIRQPMLAAMVTEKDDAVAAIIANWTPLKMNRIHTEELSTVLAQINTPKALEGIKRILFISSFTPADLSGDPVTLVKLLAGPDDAALTPAQKRFRTVMPDEGKAVLGRMLKDSKIVPAEVVRVLNLMLPMDFIYQDAAFEQTEKGAVLEAYIARTKMDQKDSTGLVTREMMRMNRLLLEASFPGFFKPALPPLDPTVYRAFGVAEALEGLSKMTLPEAQELILSYIPDESDEMTYMRILAIMDDPRATTALLERLFSADVSVSAKAVNVLSPRFATEAASIKGPFITMSRRFETELANLNPEQAHIARNYIRLCSELPVADRASAYAGALESRCAPLRDEALKALLLQADLVSNDRIATALQRLLQKDEQVVTLTVLRVLARSGLEEAIPLAAMALDSEDNTCVIHATRTLANLVGRDLGENPENWKQYFQENK